MTILMANITISIMTKITRFVSAPDSFERAMGVNDVYFTVEGRYAWVNGFGGSGMDLSNLTFSGGFLFEF